MTKRYLPRATASTIDGNTPEDSEILFDSTNKRPRIGDGSTVGGIPLAFLSDVSAGLINAVIEADNKAALSALTVGVVTAVVVHGRVSAGDGGGGVFVWRSGDQSTNVTNDPSGGVWVAPDSDTDGSSGAWMRLWDGLSDGGGLNPKWFGAKGDDSTVDSTAFSATNAYAAAVGASIRIPPGTYIIGNFQPSAGARLVGAGMGKTILKRAGSSADNNSIIAVTANNVAIEDLTLDGNKANQTLGANNIHITACGALTMRRVKSINAKLVAGGYGAGLSFYNSDDDDDDTFSEISGCVFDANDGQGALLDEVWQVGIRGNYFTNNGKSGLSLQNLEFPPELATQSQIVIDGNHALDNTGSGIELLGYFTGGSLSAPVYGVGEQSNKRIIVSSNTCAENDQYGIAAQGSELLIIGNTCHNNGADGTVYGGINANAEYSIISNNIVEHNSFWGIDAGGCYFTSVTNNHVSSNGSTSPQSGTGINLGGARYSRVAGNLLNNNGGTNGGAQITFSRNDGSGASTGGFAWDGSTCVIEDNVMTLTNSNQIGVRVYDDPNGTIVRNNSVTGGDVNRAFLIEGDFVLCQNNHHTSYLGGYTVASATTLVLPDFVETAVVSGSTAITDIRTYSQNAYHQKVSNVAVTGRGSGYTSAPTVSFSGGGGSGAAATAYINNDGELALVLMTNSGSGYTSTPTVSFSGGGGSGATATATVGVANILNRPLLLEFSDGATVTHGNNIILRDRQQFPKAAGSVLEFRGLFTNRWWETGRSANKSPLAGYLYGLTIANNASDASNDIDFAVGSCADSTGVTMINCETAYTKKLDASWAAGNNAGMLDTGSVDDGTGPITYHLFAIRKDSDGTGDFLASLSATSPTMPSGYTYFRRVASIMRLSGVIYPFKQDGDNFWWTTVIYSISANNPGTSAVTSACRAPADISPTAMMSVRVSDNSADGDTYLLITSLEQTDTTPTGELCTVWAKDLGTYAHGNGYAHVKLNTSRQFRYRLSQSTADHFVYATIMGYVDKRGRY